MIENTNFILIYDGDWGIDHVEVDSIEELLYRFLSENAPDKIDSSILKDLKNHTKEILEIVQECFDAEYTENGLQYILYARAEDTVSILGSELREIPEEIKIKTCLKYYEN